MGADLPVVEHWARQQVPVEGTPTTVLSRTFRFPDWKTALAFVNAVGALGDAQDHHPLVELTWGRVTLHCRTFDEGTVGPRDVTLCQAINAIAPT